MFDLRSKTCFISDNKIHPPDPNSHHLLAVDCMNNEFERHISLIAVEGRHAEPHTYRTCAFIFVWSSPSAVNGSRVRTYDDDVAQHGAHTGQLMHCIHLCNLILDIHFMVN